MGIPIKSVRPGSPCRRAGVSAGDELVAINGRRISDILDYMYFTADDSVTVSVTKPEGRLLTFTVRNMGRDIGLEFDSQLLDSPRRCRNRCIFCFIDQLPPGLRPTLYFKDDDERMSFLMGNYITLTNLSQSDIQRIIDMRISPVNISVHTVNPQLRARMMGNPRAADIMDILKRFAGAGICMNGQVVLCKGYNDGAELERTMDELSALHPHMASVSVVPVGLTGYREGLCQLQPFDAVESAKVIEMIESKGERNLSRYGSRIFFPADEFYIKAGRDIPDEEFYEGYPQLENGVGMVRLFLDQAEEALDELPIPSSPLPKSVATGEAAYPFISRTIDAARRKWHNLSCTAYAIKNEFFGGEITVSGLVTGTDIIRQLEGKELGQVLMIPSSMLRYERDLFLDGLSISDVERALRIRIRVTDCTGADFVRAAAE